MLRLLKLILQGRLLEALCMVAIAALIWWLIAWWEERKEEDEDSTPTPRGPTESTNDTLLGAFQPGTAPRSQAELPPPRQGLALLGKWKAALVLLAAGPLLALGVALVVSNDDGGQLHVVAVSTRPLKDVRLSMDGVWVEPTVHIGQHLVFPVPSGHHEVVLKDLAMEQPQRFVLDIREGDSLLLSMHPEMCAVQIDMSSLTYGRPTRSTPTVMGGVDVRTLPVVARYIDPTVPVDIPRDAWLSFQELPNELEPGQMASLLTPLPCSLAQDDRSTWAAVRTLHSGLNDAAQRVGYTEEDPTRQEVQGMDNGQLLDLFQRQRP
ncbi:hypothetical protein [Corallococcus sicarius]|uniref:Uncharacterized protein n=1 Tax=Corallococcus sicarius TaxID=2316726 RepID=A0A3A8NFX2_9BACT|nr:hypothetical protein [Corallococcus sicarius]RKH41121.1 hypothetical protein D7X12_19015 [Corallococcus sicarius]